MHQIVPGTSLWIKSCLNQIVPGTSLGMNHLIRCLAPVYLAPVYLAPVYPIYSFFKVHSPLSWWESWVNKLGAWHRLINAPCAWFDQEENWRIFERSRFSLSLLFLERHLSIIVCHSSTLCRYSMVPSTWDIKLWTAFLVEIKNNSATICL